MTDTHTYKLQLCLYDEKSSPIFHDGLLMLAKQCLMVGLIFALQKGRIRSSRSQMVATNVILTELNHLKEHKS